MSRRASEVQKHYDRLLGRRYGWMAGAVTPESVRLARRILEPLLAAPPPGALAVDLGCGHGRFLHPLVALGYRVVGIDGARDLLRALRSFPGPRRYVAVRDDLVRFRAHLKAPPSLVCCLGDTIAHLPSHAVLLTLFRRVFRALRPGGRFVVGFRDQRRTLSGADRVRLVKGSPDRIMQSFLEFHRRHLDVTDVFLELERGRWVQRIGRYRKIRLTTPQVLRMARRSGFRLVASSDEDMRYLAFEKSALGRPASRRPGRAA